MSNKFICTRCKHDVFYTKGQFLYCFGCDRLYSQPSKGELNKMLDGGQIHNPHSLEQHYRDMKDFDRAIRVAKLHPDRRPMGAVDVVTGSLGGWREPA